MTSSIEKMVPVKLIYILYLVGLVLGVTTLIAVIMAYVYESDDDLVIKSHCRFQIRTFWIGLLGLFVSIITSFLLVGYVLLVVWFLWVIIRMVRGMKYINNKQAHPNPQSWLFG